MKTNMIKKVLAGLLASAMVFGLAACGGSDSKSAESTAAAGTTTESAEVTTNSDVSAALNLASSNTNGSYYQWVLPMTELISKYNPNITVYAVPTAGSSENLSYLEANEAQLGGIPSATTWAYLNGKYGYETAGSGMSTFISSYGDYYYLLTSANSDINSIADMEGCKFNITPTSSSVNAITKTFFEILGYDVTEFCQTSEMTHAEAISAIQEGSIDVMAIQVGLGNSTVMELAASNAGLKIIGMTDEEANKIQEEWPGYFVKTIPAGSYEGVDADVTTVGSYFLTLVRDDVPEDVVYNMIKTVCEHSDEFVASIALAGESTAENTLTATVNGEAIPLHAGVQKYFKEIGLLE